MVVELDYVQDVLSGLNVRPYNYLDTDHECQKAVERLLTEQDREAEYVPVPFIVWVWDDGLDYDMDGNSYFDDYPDYHPASCHLTRKGAEVEAAHMEAAGIKGSRIDIRPGWVQRWELDYHPIRD